MKITTDDGVALEVKRQGEGEPFFMVHGFTGAKEDFYDHTAELAKHSEVVTLDLRGHGESDHPEGADKYSLDRLAADVLAVADALELETFGLLGHSMGGMVARRVVLAHPERVSSLVLMDTSPGPPDGVDPELAEMAARLALTEGMDALRAVLDEADVLGSEADKRVRATRPGYEEFNDRKWDAVAPMAYATLLREMIAQPHQLEELRGLACPTLVVVGDQDSNFLDDAHQMARAIAGAELAVIPEAGHSPQFENPEAWFIAVDTFVRGRVNAA